MKGFILHLDARYSALEADMTCIQGRIANLFKQYNKLTVVGGSVFLVLVTGNPWVKMGPPAPTPR